MNEHQKALAYLHEHSAENLSALKLLTLLKDDSELTYREGEGGTLLIIRYSTRNYPYDRGHYPGVKTGLVFAGNDTAGFRDLVTLPENGNLIVKGLPSSIAEALDSHFEYELKQLFYSMTVQSLIPKRHGAVYRVRNMPPEVLPLFAEMSYNKEDVETMMESDGTIFYAVLDGEVAALCISFRVYQDYYEIGSVVTGKKFRNMGYASAVVSAASYDLLKRKKIPRYNVGSENVASIRLSEKLGFTKASEFAHFEIRGKAVPVR